MRKFEVRQRFKFAIWIVHASIIFCSCCSINAGCIALPVLLNIKQALSDTQVQNMWTGEEELPVSCALYIYYIIMHPRPPGRHIGIDS